MSGKVKYHELSNQQRRMYLGDFYTMISLLGNKEESKKFFKDLLTPSEMVMICRRIQIAKLLLEEYNHREIKRKLKVGYATIDNVERWLRTGFGGYKQILTRHTKKKSRTREFSGEIFPKGMTRKKYPFHDLLLRIIDNK